MLKKLLNIIIDKNSSVLEALKQIDSVLIVIEERVVNILSSVR